MINHKSQKPYTNFSKFINPNRFIFPISFIFLLSFFVFPQNANDFETFDGTWILDEKDSFRNKKSRELYDDYVMKIDDKNDSVEIKKSYSFDGKLYQEKIILNMNKKGETNLDSRTNAKIESVSYRKKNKIFRKYTHIKKIKDKFTKYKVTEKYEISKKKNKITLVTKRLIIASSEPIMAVFVDSLGISKLKNKKIFRLKQ